MASMVFPDLKLKWLVREIKLNMPKELDFLQEAANTEKVRNMFEHMRYIKVSKKSKNKNFLNSQEINFLAI